MKTKDITQDWIKARMEESKDNPRNLRHYKVMLAELQKKEAKIKRDAEQKKKIADAEQKKKIADAEQKKKIAEARLKKKELAK